MNFVKFKSEKSERIINADHIIEIEKYHAPNGAVYYYLRTTKGEITMTPADAKQLLADLGLSFD